MATAREKKIADLRTQGTGGGLQPFVSGQPTVGSVRPEGLAPMGTLPGQTLAQSLGAQDPAGLVGNTFTPEFVRSAQEQTTLAAQVPGQEQSALANRQPTAQGRADTLAGLRTQGLASQSQERIEALKGGKDRFTTLSTPQGGFVVDKQTGLPSSPLGGADPAKQALIENLTDQISDANADFVELSKFNRPTEVTVARLNLLQGRLDELQGAGKTGGRGERRTGAPTEIATQEQYDALPSGAEYIENGQAYRKP